MEKVSTVYQIVNTVTGDCYVGSSKDVKKRWADHKCPSRWKRYPNSPMYQGMQKYGVDKFRFQILTPTEPEYLKQVEQEFIDMLQPTYNNYRAKCFVEEKEYHKEYQKEYRKSEKGKESIRKYQQSEKGREVVKKYLNQLCSYNGETLTLNALTQRFYKAGIKHPTKEAKKYLLAQQ